VATQFDILDRIQLNFTIKVWMLFFGIAVHPELSQDENVSLVHYFGRLSEGCNLELGFHDPDDGYSGHP
jgi:hypothetical protein